MSVTLRKRLNKDGSTSLILDIYKNGKRKREFLKHLKIVKVSTPEDITKNSETIQLAQKIAIMRASDLTTSDYNMTSEAGKLTLVTEWMQSYIDSYTKKDKRNMSGALKRFESFLASKKIKNLTFGELDSLILEDFIDYLEANSKGEGASSYYSRFKKMIKYAFRKRLIKENPLDFVEKRIKGKARKKDVLSIDEIEILAATPIENLEIKRAFLFCLFTGLRWIDIKENLLWSCIDLKNAELSLRQSKTNEDLIIGLNDSAIKVLLDKSGKPKELVFNLPTHDGANKTLKAWIKRAKINKSITWHNARHSFGTNLILQDVGVLTAQHLLGHTSLKHTQRYVNTARQMREKATDKLNVKFEL